MSWEVEYTDDFAQWWMTLKEAEQDSIYVVVNMLEEEGTKYIFLILQVLKARNILTCGN